MWKEYWLDCCFDVSVMYVCLFFVCVGVFVRDWVMMLWYGIYVGLIGKFRLWGGW